MLNQKAGPMQCRRERALAKQAEADMKER